MAERVIDTLEAVQIEIHDRHSLTGIAGIRELRGGCFDTTLAIGKSGQHMHVRESLDVLCGGHAFGGVLANDYDIATFAASESQLVGMSGAVGTDIAVIQ